MKTHRHKSPIGLTPMLLASLFFLGACQPFTVSVNDQPVYDPDGRLIGGEAIDADLQGCINYALNQQDLEFPAQLTVLTCANSDIRNLENIGLLRALRFLDLGNNSISNITPLEELPNLGGLNLNNNAITDIAPLFNIPTLTSVSLQGNNNIPCSQLDTLRERLGSNLTPPERCRG